MFATFLTWRADFEWEPADYTIHCKTRVARPELPVAAPCVYALGIEGKEGLFWRTLLDTYDSLSAHKKLQLSTLVSDVEEEFMAAAKIMYDVLKKAVRSQGSKPVRRARSWWAREVQCNVSQHMGWLGKGLSDNFFA